MGEHRWIAERRSNTYTTAAGERYVIAWVRFKCECGKATNWYRDEVCAGRARDRHATNGQQSLL